MDEDSRQDDEESRTVLVIAFRQDAATSANRCYCYPARSPLCAQEPAALAFPGTLLFSFALVVELLAARKRELDLGAALFVEIELERHKRHALALDRAGELVDLAPMQQELARALGRMVEAAGLQVLGNIGVDQPDL